MGTLDRATLMVHGERDARAQVDRHRPFPARMDERLAAKARLDASLPHPLRPPLFMSHAVSAAAALR